MPLPSVFAEGQSIHVFTMEWICSWEYRGSSHFSCKVLRRMKFSPCRRIGNFVAKDSLRRTQKYIPVRWDTFLYHCVSFYSLIFLLVDSITDWYLLWTINFFLLFIALSFIHVVARSTIATYCFIYKRKNYFLCKYIRSCIKLIIFYLWIFWLIYNRSFFDKNAEKYEIIIRCKFLIFNIKNVSVTYILEKSSRKYISIFDSFPLKN